MGINYKVVGIRSNNMDRYSIKILRSYLFGLFKVWKYLKYDEILQGASLEKRIYIFDTISECHTLMKELNNIK